MRAATSLPEPVGPRISTAISDFEAARIDSKTTSIFSSRPMRSRKCCAAGEVSSTLVRTGRFSSASMSGPQPPLFSASNAAVAGADQAGLDEIVQAVLDILRQPREVLRQRVEREPRLGPLMQMAQQRRPQGRLDERGEAVGAIDEKAWIVAAAIAEPGWFHDMHGRGAGARLDGVQPSTTDESDRAT